MKKSVIKNFADYKTLWVCSPSECISCWVFCISMIMDTSKGVSSHKGLEKVTDAVVESLRLRGKCFFHLSTKIFNWRSFRKKFNILSLWEKICPIYTKIEWIVGALLKPAEKVECAREKSDFLFLDWQQKPFRGHVGASWIECPRLCITGWGKQRASGHFRLTSWLVRSCSEAGRVVSGVSLYKLQSYGHCCEQTWKMARLQFLWGNHSFLCTRISSTHNVLSSTSVI